MPSLEGSVLAAARLGSSSTRVCGMVCWTPKPHLQCVDESHPTRFELMNQFFLRVIALPFFILLAVIGISAGGSWSPLFNGRDLSGWRAEGNEKWSVQDGAILGEAATDRYGYLVTEKTYRDFELRLKFKCDAPGNYGVFVRSRMKGEGKWGPDIEGLQVEIDPSRDTAGIYESSGRQWIIKPSPEAQRAMK